MLLANHYYPSTANHDGPSRPLEPSQTPVGRVMSTAPVVAQHDMPLEDARELMLRARIRHLPIMNGDRLVDVVTDRDLANYYSLVRNSQGVTVGEVLTGAAPYLCTQDTPLDVVSRCMVATMTEVAVVVDEDMHVKGIFTAIDALRCVGGELRLR